MISKTFPDRMILTTSGVKNINDVLPGDYVYEWKTSRHLEIKDIQMLPFHNMYELTYSDGRIEYIVDPEAIYLDQSIVSPHNPFCKCLTTKDFPIKLYPIDFGNKDSIRIPLDPDPYVAGALLIHGDLTDEFMNYPSDRDEVNDQLSRMYNLDHHSEKDGKVYFKYKGVTMETPITWKEFFGNSTFDNGIPSEYIYTEPWNRVQFLRGAFDSGYSKDRSPNVAIYHSDMEKINIVKSILYSLGVSSFVYESEDKEHGRIYGLEITGLPSTWPGFFYDYDYIVRMVNRSFGRNFRNASESDYATVTLVDIKGLGCDRYWRNLVPHIVLEEPHMIYTSANYLPRVSI